LSSFSGRKQSFVKKILTKCAEIILSDGVIAMKGLGGYHLMCDAYNEKASFQQRKIKKRENKPFVLICKDIQSAREIAHISNEEKEVLDSWQKPTVLLKSKNKTPKSVQNGLDILGVMLPYMPFHYILFDQLKANYIVLTSGNISDELIVIKDETAIKTFKNLTEAVLTYNREIHNRTDDSVVQLIEGRRLVRRYRGYAPSSIKIDYPTEGIFAAGAELSNTFSTGKLNRVYLSQHIEDLKNAETFEFYEESIKRYTQLFKFSPKIMVCDLHPDYLSAQYAENYAVKYNLPILKVQYPHAHVASVMADCHLDEKVIGISMDGVGLVTDGTIWEGEFFICDLNSVERQYQFEAIPVAGADRVSKELWRSAISYLQHYQIPDFQDLPFYHAIDKNKPNVYQQMLLKQVNMAQYSSAGRLFDAVAAICNITLVSGFHAEAPIRLENLVKQDQENHAYSYKIKEIIVTFKPCFEELVEDLKKGVNESVIALKFHNTFVNAITETARLMSVKNKINKVVLSGGSFQNKYLAENLVKKLTKLGIEVFLPQNIPVNGGGIAIRQTIIAAKKQSLGEISF